MAIADDALIEELLYGTPQGRRFLQDSPVMPDLWSAFARNPIEPQEVLITPHRDVRAAEVARRLRADILHTREVIGRRVAETYRYSGLRLAPLSSQVAVRLSFLDLIGTVIPLTDWWWSMMRSGVRKPGMEWADFRNLLATALIESQEPVDLPSGLVWLARLAGVTHLSTRSEAIKPDVTEVAWALARPSETEEESVIDLREVASLVSEAFFELMPEFSFDMPEVWWSVHPTPHRLVRIHRVARNRRVELAVNKSSTAIKADAARRLFDISCRHITWAVIDSGIDTDHNAFKDHIGGRSRVDAVYDFTILRQINDLDAVIAALDSRVGDPLFAELIRRQKEPPDEDDVIRILEAHRGRLEAGDDIDYNLIEPFLRDHNPLQPRLRHGTHVAGILGADWRESGARKMTGVCPDIRLIDMRVIRPDGESDEFEVISALEFLRYYNDRSSRLAIHGANLSLSIDQNLKGGDACGQTPVCVECERTISKGVCVVVAAGNRGNVKVERIVKNQRRRMDMYVDASITDPGNADGVITVGATHRNRPHEYGVSFFSSRGPTGDGRLKPDLVAPGEKITGPAPGQDKYESDGTSMAAPHVSGAAALVMARHAEMIGRPQRIKQILCDTATDLKREPYFQGAGLVDVLRALQSI